MTKGLSPKTLAATLAPLLPAVILVLAGLATGQDAVLKLGLGLLAGSPVAGVAAYRADPGEVVQHVGAPSDASLTDEAAAKLARKRQPRIDPPDLDG